MDDDQRRSNEELDDDIDDVEAHRKSNLGAADEGEDAETEDTDFELHRKSNLS